MSKTIAICTAALIPKHYQMRQAEYQKGISSVVSLGFETYVVESCVTGPTFLDELGAKVIYAQCNDPRYGNKGINEAKALLAVLDLFSESDMILKITGRYLITNTVLIDLLQQNPLCDAIVKYDRTVRIPFALTGCFVMRCGLLRQFLKSLNFERMEQRMISLETELAHFVGKHCPRLIVTEELGVLANVFYDGNRMRLKRY